MNEKDMTPGRDNVPSILEGNKFCMKKLEPGYWECKVSALVMEAHPFPLLLPPALLLHRGFYHSLKLFKILLYT